MTGLPVVILAHVDLLYPAGFGKHPESGCSRVSGLYDGEERGVLSPIVESKLALGHRPTPWDCVVGDTSRGIGTSPSFLLRDSMKQSSLPRSYS